MFIIENSVPAALAAGVSAGATSFTVDSVAGFPVVTTALKGYAKFRIDGGTAAAEDAKVTNINTGTKVCTCAALVSDHLIGATVETGVVDKESLNQIKDDAITGGPVNPITGTDTLILGVTNLATVTAAAATLTIPDGSYIGQACRLVMATTCTKLATLSATGADVTGRILWAGEHFTASWNGTAWVKLWPGLLPMICSIARNGALSIAGDNAVHLITFDTTEKDNTGLMADLGNNAIVIKRTGNYRLTGTLRFSLANAQNIMAQYIYLNNTTIHALDERQNILGSGTAVLFASRVIALTAGDSITTKALLAPGTGSASQALSIGTPPGATNGLQVEEILSW